MILGMDHTSFFGQLDRLASPPSLRRPNCRLRYSREDFAFMLFVFRFRVQRRSPKIRQPGMVPKWNAWRQSDTPHSPAAARFVEHGLFLYDGRSLGEADGEGGRKCRNLSQ